MLDFLRHHAGGLFLIGKINACGHPYEALSLPGLHSGIVSSL
jgi:hypothetical protein